MLNDLDFNTYMARLCMVDIEREKIKQDRAERNSLLRDSQILLEDLSHALSPMPNTIGARYWHSIMGRIGKTLAELKSATEGEDG